MKPGEMISCFDMKILFVKRTFWLMLFCLHWVWGSQDFAICSDIEKNIISFPKIQVASNHTGTIEIHLDNQESISSGQIEFEYDSTTGFDIDVAEASTLTRTESFMIAPSKVSSDPENVKILLLFYSMVGTQIEPGSGSIIKLVYRISEEASGETSIQFNIDETILSDESANELALSYENGFVNIDDKPPVISGLQNDDIPVKKKIWSWFVTDEECLYRHAIDQSNTWEASGDFNSITSASIDDNYTDGQWYFHVQAKDRAGNKSDIISVYSILDNTPPIALFTQKPEPIVSEQEIYLTIAGEGVISYKYKLSEIDNYSEEKLVSEQIHLTDLNEESYKIFVIGKDQAGNWQKQENASTTSWIVEYTKPVVRNLKNETEPVQEMEWHWFANKEGCTFRYSVNQNSNWEPAGNYNSTVTASIDEQSIDGKWYLHVQAKDKAGNESDVVSVSVILDNTAPVISVLKDDEIPAQEKIWEWFCINNEECIFRHTIDQNDTWEASGEFNSITSASIDDNYTDGQWYFHVQAKDRAGNKSDIISVYSILDNTPPITIFTQKPDPISDREVFLSIGGEGVISYKYKLSEIDNYSEEKLVSEQIHLTDLNEDSYKIFVIGKDQAGNWQKQENASMTSWIVEYTKPVVINLKNETEPVQKMEWHWSANKEGCTFRYSVNQSSNWEPVGNYNSTVTASINEQSIDGKWYLHVQAKDRTGNESDVVSVSVILDNAPPVISDLTDDKISVKKKTWNWLIINDECLYRHTINQNETWEASGEFNSITSASIDENNTDGQWYLHVQAKDKAGNNSDIISVYTILDNTPPVISGIKNDSTPIESKIWHWTTSDEQECIYRFAIDKNETWSPTGSFGETNAISINHSEYGSGKWFLHVQAKDKAGNVSNIVTVSTVIKEFYNAPEKPVLKNPPDNSVLNLTDQQLSTNPFSDLNDDTYHQKTHWQISTDSSYSTLILDIESEKSLTSLLIFKIMLTNDATYFWRVCFSNGKQFSEWSDSFSFTIENEQNDDKDANGISDSQELTDTTLDLDNNDISDIHQDDFKCLKAMKGNITIGVKSNEDATIESIESIDSSSITDTTNKPDITLPYGLIGFRLKGDPGFKSDVDIYLSTPLPDNSIWYKYDYLNGWFDYSEHTTISSDRKTVTVMLQDGEFGDLDGTKNGIIVDPSGPGIQNINKPGNKIDNDDDNSNCFISTILWND